MPTHQDDEVFTTWASDLDDSNACVLFLCGELDASSAPAFLAETRKIVSDGRDIIMDVHLLSYTDSTGVAAMLSIKNALDRAGRKMLLVGCHGLLTRILRATTTDGHLPCCEDISQAVQELREH